MASPSAYRTRVRTQVTRVIDEVLALRAMVVEELNALGGPDFYAKLPDDGELTSEEFRAGVEAATKLSEITASDMAPLFKLRV